MPSLPLRLPQIVLLLPTPTSRLLRLSCIVRGMRPAAAGAAAGELLGRWLFGHGRIGCAFG